jgi:FKBP-type peptidyl-prolyl cis-trans isomerase FkpA
MRYIKSIFFLAFIGLMASCNNDMNFGRPQYDVEGNLVRDRQLIAEYLESAPFDSLYRVHDESGVVVIVQEEGTGSRPNHGNIVHTTFTGMLTDGSVFTTTNREVAEEHGLFVEGQYYGPTFFQLGDQGNDRRVYGLWFGFRRMRSGTKGVVIVPSVYGNQNREDLERVPPNSILVYEVDFLGFD